MGKSLATAGLERAKKQRPKERRRSGLQTPPVVVVCALEASSCSHGHGESTLVSHVQQGLVEERKFLKFGDCTSRDFRDFPMRKRPALSELEIPAAVP